MHAYGAGVPIEKKREEHFFLFTQKTQKEGGGGAFTGTVTDLV